MTKIHWAKEMGWNEEHLTDLTNAAYAYVRQGKYEIALPVFEALCLLDPDEPYYPQTLGAIYLEMKMPQKALEVLESALKIDADHSATMLNMTKALFELGKVKEGIKLAKLLANDKNALVSSSAKALLLAYEPLIA
jgi:predicted Zn-dependent protease